MVITKPKNIPDDNWHFLNGFSFGFLMFGSPPAAEGNLITQTIVDCYEDGDLYFLCWDEEILSLISSVDYGGTVLLPVRVETDVLPHRCKFRFWITQKIMKVKRMKEPVILRSRYARRTHCLLIMKYC
jgi:hypothetical protein